MDSGMDSSSMTTSVVQVTNIAPQATRDQMVTLFSFVGRVEDCRLYPSVRDAGVSVTSRCCFVKFADPKCVAVTLHLNNTVFIDRAIIITSVPGNVLPDEHEGLFMAMQVQQQQGNSSVNGSGIRGLNSDAKLLAANPGLVTATATGEIATVDQTLDELGLPSYPLLPGNLPITTVEEIRRTVTIAGLDSTVSAQQCMEFFAEKAGEVKYFRYCTHANDAVKYALVEFSDRQSVANALQLNGSVLGTTTVQVLHATEPIQKPQQKSNEAAQKEIEEAMSKVKEANCLVSAAVDPLIGMLGGAAAVGAGLASFGSSLTMRSTRSRSRGMSSRRSRSPHSRRRRSRSRDRRRYRSRSRSRDRRRHRRSRSKSRERRRRSKSRDRKKEKSKEKEENGTKENGKSDELSIATSRRSKSKSPVPSSRRRSKSRERRRRSRSRDRNRRKRSRSRSRRRRSRSRDRRRGSSRERHRRSRSRDKRRSKSKDRKVSSSPANKKSVENKVTRDYDQEEAGFENNPKISQKQLPKQEKDERTISVKQEEIPIKQMEPDDMEISNSP